MAHLQSHKCCNIIAAALFVISLASAGPPALAEDIYKPAINPADFTTAITNPYFSMPVGKTMVYEGLTNEGIKRIEIRIPGETKTVMGVKTLIYWDRVWLNGKIHEDTRDYISQDRDGNVWYFGEAVDNYENGKIVNHDGAWEAGVDGAMPGIWIKAKQIAGDSYRQEYAKGAAEDWARVVAVGESVAASAKRFTDCAKIYEWDALDPDTKEHKYYCPAAGGVVLIEDLESGERTELIKVETGG